MSDTETALKTDVLHCARCGEDHQGLWFKKFQQPVEDSDGTIWDWWASCPNTGDPILLRKIEGK